MTYSESYPEFKNQALKKRDHTWKIIIAVFLALAAAFMSYVFITDNGYTLPESSSEIATDVHSVEGEKDKSSDDHIGVDLNGNKIDNVDVSRTEKIGQVSNIGVVVRIPAIKSEFLLGEVDVVDGELEPTNYTSIFQVRNIGVPYTENNKGTTYLVAHAMDLIPGTDRLSGISPGNFFFNPSTGTPSLKPGDIMVIGEKRFVYERSDTIPKDEINQQKDLWDSSIPNRVVFITCLSNKEDNIVSYWRAE